MNQQTTINISIPGVCGEQINPKCNPYEFLKELFVADENSPKSRIGFIKVCEINGLGKELVDFEKGCGASIQFFKLVNEIFGYGAGDSLMAITLNYLTNYIKTHKHIK